MLKNLPFHLMLKPVGARCNMRCDYCFYSAKRLLYPQSSLIMSSKVLERCIKQMTSAYTSAPITFGWQGGEPTLMGIDFYKQVTRLQKKYAPPHVTIENSLQTNGILIDEDWCRFLSENNFLVGLSIDGPREFHDTFRKNKNGGSVFDKVIRAVKLMQKFNVPFNVLCTINSANCEKPLEVYRFFRDELEAHYLQFIPLVNADTVTGQVTRWTVPSLEYGVFLTTIFDEWIKRDVGSMFVQLFDGVLASYVFGQSILCVLQPACGRAVAMEHNGDVYSCDHYVLPKYLLGNIRQVSIEKLVDSQKQQQFGMSKSSDLPSYCKSCEFLFTCYGECPKNRLLNSPDGNGKLSWLCAGLKHFFTHTKKPMKAMASQIIK